MLELWVCWHRVKYLPEKVVTNMLKFPASTSLYLLDFFLSVKPQVSYVSNKPWALIFLSEVVSIWCRQCSLGTLRYRLRGWNGLWTRSCSLFMVLSVLHKVPREVVMVWLLLFSRYSQWQIFGWNNLFKLKCIYCGKWVLP